MTRETMANTHHEHRPMQHETAQHETMQREQHYLRLLLMTVLSFFSMYVLMYVMVNVFANVYNNLNQVYMAGLMTAPMVLIELLLMRSMYHNKTWNAVIGAVSVVALIGFWLLIRQQTAITDRQFLRSMIPHHAGAILMCEQAALTDAEISALCDSIVASQEAEIQQMKTKLAALNR